MKSQQNIIELVTRPDIDQQGNGEGGATVFGVDGKRRQETSKEKDIRLGVMTAFGTVLRPSDGTNTREDDGQGFRDYVREHADIDVATRSAARRRQDKAAGKPSKSRQKSVEDREARAEKEEEYDHGTDDSDWESSRSGH